VWLREVGDGGGKYITQKKKRDPEGFPQTVGSKGGLLILEAVEHCKEINPRGDGLPFSRCRGKPCYEEGGERRREHCFQLRWIWWFRQR